MKIKAGGGREEEINETVHEEKEEGGVGRGRVDKWSMTHETRQKMLHSTNVGTFMSICRM